MLYEDFIYKLNNGEATCVDFSIKGYDHYEKCRIFRQIDITKQNKKISLIVCQLTVDEYEKVSFLNRFDEKYKLFNLGRKGKFTLKQIWDKVCITEIVYSEQK